MPNLKREIGFPLLLLLAINAILGSDIFFEPGIAASFAGPASLIAWVGVAAIAILMACFFGELVSIWPKAGGIYEYAKHSLSEPLAFVVGWLAWLTAVLSIATELVGGLLYLMPTAGFWVHLTLVVGFLLFFSAIAWRGIKLSAAILLIFGITTLTTVLALIFIGAPAVDTSNFFPFFAIGLPGIAIAAFFIAGMFFGWEGVTYLSEEVRNPRKTVPKVLVAATTVIGVLGILVASVSLGVVPWETLAKSTAPLTAVSGATMPSISFLFDILVAIAIIGTAAGWVVAAPRLLFAMARDKMFVRGIQKLHPKYKTPYLAIALQAALVLIIAPLSFLSIKTLYGLLIPMYIMMYIIFLMSYVKLRSLKIERPFKAPLPRIGPVIAALFLAGSLIAWLTTAGAFTSLAIIIVLLLSGFPAYIIIKLQTDRSFVEKFWNSMAAALDIYVPMLLSSQWNRVLSSIKIEPDHTVLDYGCGAGWLTEKLSKCAKCVVAADLSEKQLHRALARMSHAKKDNVIFVKTSRPAPFPRSSFDRIVCTLAINYFVNPKDELKKLAMTLKRGGKALFLAIRAPGLTIQPFLAADKSIQSVFKSAGFKKTEIRRICTFGREYIYVSATK